MAYGTLNAGSITPGSGNTLTISETVALTGTVTAGLLGAGVALKIHSVTSSTDTGNVDASSGYNFGTALAISSANNPNGAKYLVICGGGRLYANSGDGKSFGVMSAYLTGGTSWTTTNGTQTPHIIQPIQADPVVWRANPMAIGLYTNSTGSAVAVEFKTRLWATASSSCRAEAGTNVEQGLIAIRVH